VTTTPPSATPALAQSTPAPGQKPAGAPAWLIPIDKRTSVVVPFLLAHLFVPYANSLVTRALIDSVARTGLGLVLSVNSFVTRLVLCCLQAVILRKYVPPGSWLLLSIGGILVASVIELFVLSTLFSAFGLGAYRVVGPPLWWFFISSAQSLALRSHVQSPWLWIAASVGAGFCAAFIVNTAVAAGAAAGVLIFPWIGLSVGIAQCWCLIQFVRLRPETPR
jgi:hypothetical protein